LKPYYDNGQQVIYHGDCREILPTLPKVDLVLTDPPYGILNLQGQGSTTAVRKSPRQQGSGKLKGRILNVSDVQWDIAPSADLLDELRAMSTDQIIWGGNYFGLPPCRGILAWDKEQPWPNFSQVEIAWTTGTFPAKIFRFSTTYGMPNRVHPTQKPTEVMVWCLTLFPSSKTVLDPYMGSGTTLVAAKQLDRACIGIEINESYCEIAARRLEDTTPSLFSETA